MRPSAVITAATCYGVFAACVCPCPILAVLFIYLLDASATTTESLRAVSPGVLWMDVLQERLSSATRLASTRVKFTAAQSPPTLSNQFFPGLPPVRYCSVLFFSRPRSEGWPHHGRILSPFIPVLCHSDWLFHGESFPRLDVVHPGRAWPSSPTCT